MASAHFQRARAAILPTRRCSAGCRTRHAGSVRYPTLIRIRDNAMMRTADLPKKIAVLMGGPSTERDVSLATGHGISKALRSLGAEVVGIDVRDKNFQLPKDLDLAFNALHGTFGEDGQVQQILEARGVAYTGEGVEESRLAFDKIRSKERFGEHGVSTPEWEVIGAHQRPLMQLPVVVKAPRQGSTVGVCIVKNAEELEPALAEAAKYDHELLREKFMPGRVF